MTSLEVLRSPCSNEIFRKVPPNSRDREGGPARRRWEIP